MLKVLLIFEYIPEQTIIYLIEVDNDEMQNLLDCHGKFGNSDDGHLVNTWLPDWIQTKHDCIVLDGVKKIAPFQLMNIKNPLQVIITGINLANNYTYGWPVSRN